MASCLDCRNLASTKMSFPAYGFHKGYPCRAIPAALVGGRRWTRNLDYHSDELPCPDFAPRG